eukprot:TRINITY_DN33545_c0_g1_i1.p1 TRINITY_DN33545_c0_g1~~TRINITY_DN33545_c0_g1_i1.p1  ORF type:complete len:353 (+),score=98.72 TRINITY_DN33545_c0_g1_i1:108-1061(+)
MLVACAAATPAPPSGRSPSEIRQGSWLYEGGSYDISRGAGGGVTFSQGAVQREVAPAPAGKAPADLEPEWVVDLGDAWVWLRSEGADQLRSLYTKKDGSGTPIGHLARWQPPPPEPLRYTYGYTQQPVLWGDHYADDGNRVLNDGDRPSSISRTNCVAWASTFDDWEPVMALSQGLSRIDEIRISYVVKRGWSKYRPQSAVFDASLDARRWGQPAASSGPWDGEDDGGYSKVIRTPHWDCVRYVRLRDLVPSAQQSVVSEIELFGGRCAEKKVASRYQTGHAELPLPQWEPLAPLRERAAVSASVAGGLERVLRQRR